MDMQCWNRMGCWIWRGQVRQVLNNGMNLASVTPQRLAYTVTVFIDRPPKAS